MCMYYIFFIHSSVSGHSHCFYVLGIANSAIVNTGVHVAFWIMVFSRSFLYFNCHFIKQTDFPGGSDGKASASNAGDPGSVPGSGRSPGKGNGNPLQYSCLGNSHGQRRLVWLQSIGLQRVGPELETKKQWNLAKLVN